MDVVVSVGSRMMLWSTSDHKIMVRKTFRVDELAKDWGVNPRTIRREIDRGKLDAFKVGDTWRIPVEEAQKYQEEQQKKVTVVYSTDSTDKYRT